MDVVRLIAFTLVLIATSSLATSCFAKNDVVLEVRSWPDSEDCQRCVDVQFGMLEMRLPLSAIGKLLVNGSEDSALHILPIQGEPRQGVLFLTVGPERLLGKYRQSGLLQGLDIETNEDFFDALGRVSVGQTPLENLRRIEHIDMASRYTKTSNGRVHVYWIEADPTYSQYVYFVVDGLDEVYMLAGNVTKELYEAVLSNLRITPLP